ncbi:TraB/GumN family protein [Oleiagrimonas soli]|uniref:Pheromone shutdown-related protein TraB n=1 Tax=Oleiagrimonas soli TaxID=1543381 RepID=A0A099CYY2_9GAMM|nr:TraB/GumN family protein [Oleiagrimonas soli]KGI78235.1 TraB family protein [Oleiagrimonas soli]MBB6183298.1 pheromone shutdown-related protein TraB [Oleiagrimonas soli]
MNETVAPLTENEIPDALDGQPIERVVRDGVEYVILGTAHVSRASVAAVEALCEREPFDAIAVELCDSRARSMRDPDAFKRMDLFQVIRQGKTGMVAASLVLGSFQKRLAEQYGIESGAEMKAAMQSADRDGRALWTIDRDVGLTLKRAWRSLGFREKFGVLSSLVGSLFEREDIAEEEIEKLKSGDMLEGAFSEFAKSSEGLYNGLIAERDAFMAARLREQAARSPDVRKVLVVIGAGHLKGLCTHLAEQDADPSLRIAELERMPPAARWPRYLGFGLVLAIFIAIGFAFHRSTALGTDALLTWVLCTGILGATGALVAGGHPLSIVASFIAAPLKPIRMAIPAGAIGALTEVWLRKPQVSDFETMRDDIGHWRGWWRNRVVRVFLLFTLVNIGTIIGEYVAGVHILHSLL